MNIRIFRPFLAWFLVTGVVFAEGVPRPSAPDGVTPNVLQPGPISLAKLPDFASWSVDYTYAVTPSKGDRSRPIRLVVTRTGKTIHEVRTYGDGLESETWSNGQITTNKAPDSEKAVAVLNVAPPGDDFPEFDWISRDHYIGVKTRDGQRYLVFAANQFSSQGDFLGAAYAYVDAVSRLPCTYELPGQSRKYTILPPPSEPLKFPDYAASVGKKMLGQLQSATPHLSPP